MASAPLGPAARKGPSMYDEVTTVFSQGMIAGLVAGFVAGFTAGVWRIARTDRRSVSRLLGLVAELRRSQISSLHDSNVIPNPKGRADA